MYIVLIHWKPAEAEPLRNQLFEAGYSVEVLAPTGAAGLKRINEDVDAVLIDLSRLPTQGCAVGVQVRKRPATRSVPIVFVGGAPEKVAAVRAVLPDAGFIQWSGVPAELERAIRRAPQSPVVPSTMAPYSGAPLSQKLGIKPGSTVAVIAAPEGFAVKLEPLPAGARLVSKLAGADRSIVFVRSMNDVRCDGAKAVDKAAQGVTVWIGWPKKASGVRSDVTETSIRAWAIERGWVDYKVCCVDDTWSAVALGRKR